MGQMGSMATKIVGSVPGINKIAGKVSGGISSLNDKTGGVLGGIWHGAKQLAPVIGAVGGPVGEGIAAGIGVGEQAESTLNQLKHKTRSGPAPMPLGSNMVQERHN